MSSQTRSFTPLLIFALVAGTSPLVAAPVISTATNTPPIPGTVTTGTTDELAYSSFVSTTDLLHGITGTGGTWNANGSSPAGLNDGVHGGDSNVSVPLALSGATWAANGTVSFREFVLGTGANGLGFDITGVQSIAAWQGAGFQNQKHEILVSTVGSASFTLLTTVDFQPSTSTAPTSVDGGSTKVNVTDTTGILATGIDAIRFNVLDTVGDPGGGALFRELDVFGRPTGPDSAAEFSNTQFVYSGNVSAADLLHGLTPVTSGWNKTNEASPLELNDGIHGVGFGVVPGDRVQGAWTTVGATAEYHLNLGTSAAGYDITSVQSIADWVNVGFGNQAWRIEVKPVGGSYSTLATVNHQPLGAGGGTTKVTLSDPSGVVASGVESIKITANQVNGGTNAGAFVWRELDVFGVPSNDETPPQIVTLNPADDLSNVSPSSNIVATFSENIALGTGTLTIKSLDTPAATVITLPDARVAVSGALLTINPDTDLTAGTHYAVRIDATAIDDLAGNPFAGIDNDTAWDFTTGTPDLTAPTPVSFNPADGATTVPLASNLVATFDENIALGTGSITIENLDAASQTVITLPDGRVSVSGAVLTINPSTKLAPSTDYAVRIASGTVTDLSGNPFGGIDDDTSWNFVTASTPLRVMCLGDSITTGYTDNPGWANHPFKFGYRGGLYTLLTNAGYNFLFVGGSTEPWTGISGDPTSGGTYTPALDLRPFGQDGHRGYGGTTASGLQGNIVSWLASDDPDLILLKIGTNSQSTSALDTLVNTIVTNKPDAHLIIAEIMPKYSYQAGIVNYNTYIRNTLVPNYQAQGKKVTLVNQYAPFLTNPADLTSIDQSLFSNGINHPDNDGYDKMARVWFDRIETLGIGPNSFDTWISNPGFGVDPAKRGLDDDADGDGVENGVESYFGTDPGDFSRGIIAGVKSGNTFTFTHPLSDTPATDLDATYRWSKDLSTFTPDAAAFGGTTVTFTPGTPSGGFVTVTATVGGTSLDKLFVDVEVTRN